MNMRMNENWFEVFGFIVGGKVFVVILFVDENFVV